MCSIAWDYVPLAAEPPCFIGIKLHDFQRQTIAFLLGEENDPRANHIRLNEPFGCGKTFIILGLIMLRPLPLLRPYYMGGLELRPRVVIRPTAIVVSRMVMAQWEAHITDRTSLSYYAVRKGSDIDDLAALIASGRVNAYDIILIKAGNVACADGFVWGTTKAVNKIRVGPERAVPWWARVVYDDVDTMYNCRGLRALVSYHVTATLRRFSDEHLGATRYSGTYRTRYAVAETYGSDDLGDNYYAPRTSALWGRVMGRRDLRMTPTALPILHDPEFVARFGRVPKIIVFGHTISNKAISSCIRLIDLAVGDHAAITDMIQGDAMSLAAKSLGISVATPAAIFARILGTQQDAHNRAVRRLAALQEKQSGADCVDDGEGGEDDDEGRREEIEQCSRIIEQGARSIERMRENLAEELCQICFSPLAECHVMITRCCGLICCASCAIRSKIELCPQCRTKMCVERDWLFVERGLNIKDLVQDVAKVSRDIVPGTSDEGSSSRSAGAEEGGAPPTKIAEIIRILSAAAAEADPSSSPYVAIAPEIIDPKAIPHLMTSDRLVPLPRGHVRKFMICGDFDESLWDIERAIAASSLVARNCRISRLLGGVGDIAEAMARYVNCPLPISILLVNMRLLFAGADLQATTDIIILSDGNSERLGQIIGRAQRFGRTHSLTVRILRYRRA